jgi:hypothetical protein
MLSFNNNNLKQIKTIPLQKNDNKSNTNILRETNQNDLIKEPKNKIHKKSLFEKGSKKYKSKIKNSRKELNKIIILEDEDNNDNNSKRKFCFVDDNKDIKNITRKNNKNINNLLYKKKPLNNNLEMNKGKKQVKNLIFTNNISPTINIQTPLVNINNNKQKKKSENENK